MTVAQAAALVRQEVGKAVAGQEAALELAFVAVLADGHCLLEGVPGLGKTLIAKSLARTLDLDFKRVQFTPDLMPSDVVGTNVFNPQTAEFTLRQGPIFAALLLADEVNRTPPKTQSALLEAMEERQATIDGVRYALPYPFLVFATQNPIEQEGTYPLPEAQQDRFLFKIVLEYPGDEAEIDVLRRHHAGFRATDLDAAGIQPVIGAERLQALRHECRAVRVEDKVLNYIQATIRATRTHHDILVGASTRAGLALLNAGKALAAVRGRDFLIPDDVKDLTLPVLRHRVILRPEAEIEGFSTDQVIAGIVGAQVVPR